jgi:CelD/BcsL family acetyltransferase involved in cellulose biosynthesis
MYAVVDPAHIKDRTEYFYMTTYSTAHAELCPGTLLIAMQMERARSEGFRTIDMLRGDEDFKRTIWHMNLSPTYGFALQPASQSQQDQAAVGALA